MPNYINARFPGYAESGKTGIIFHFKLASFRTGCIRALNVQHQSLQQSSLLLRRIFLSFNRYRLNGKNSKFRRQQSHPALATLMPSTA